MTRDEKRAYYREWWQRNRDRELAKRRDRYHARKVSTRYRVTWAAAVADDIDEAVVQRLMDGDPPASFTSYERREAVRRLVAVGFPKREVARILRIHDRQVYRDLDSLRSLSRQVAS